MRVLVSGGPGSGCTSAAKILSEKLRVPFVDSDTFFFKPTNPPYLEQYSPEERRKLLSAELLRSEDWRFRTELIDLASHLEFLTSERSDKFKQTCVERIQKLIQRNNERG